MSLDYGAELPELAVMFYGLGGPYYGPTGGRYALRAYYPLVSLWGDWELNLMLNAEVAIPARFMVLEARYHLRQNSTSSPHRPHRNGKR